MKKELVKNTAIYIIMSFFNQGLIFLLWIVFAWWLAPSQIGIYALALFIIEFFSAISIFGLGSAITRFYHSKDSISSILSNALVIFFCSTILSLSLFFFAAEAIPSFIPGLSEILKENLVLFGAIIFVNSLANFGLVHYIALREAGTYAKLQLVKILFFCFPSFMLVRIGMGVFGIFYALLVSSLLIAVLFFLKEKENISLKIISPKIIKNIISYSYPIVLYSALGIVVSYFSRLLLDKYTNLATLGVYSFFLTLTLQVNGLWSSFNRAWTPEIFSQISANRTKTMRNIKFMAFFSSFAYLLALALFIILGELFLFKLMLREVYLSNIYLFYILLLGPLFTGIYTAAYPLYYYRNKTKIILYISLLLYLVNVPLTFFMVKLFNQTGAALSYFIMLIFTVLTYLLSFKKIMQIPEEIISWTLFLSGLMIANVIFFLKTSSVILFLGFILLSAALAYKIGNLSEYKTELLVSLKEIYGK